MAINAEFTKKFADAYYGPGAVIGDGKLLEAIMKLIMSLLGGGLPCAKRAHAMVNGGPFQQLRARRRIWWEAYDMTGDGDDADRIVDAAMTVGHSSTVEEFADFAKP